MMRRNVRGVPCAWEYREGDELVGEVAMVVRYDTSGSGSGLRYEGWGNASTKDSHVQAHSVLNALLNGPATAQF